MTGQLVSSDANMALIPERPFDMEVLYVEAWFETK